MLIPMKLRQGQIWKLDGQYIRIVVLERLAVEYKTMEDPQTREGTRHLATKKQFCTLIKKATLVLPEGIQTP
jgi:hypothetical protein